MPFNVKKVSLNFAVMSFFSLSIIASICGLSTFVCCKRAVIGAFIVYIITNLTIRLINLVLVDAMISKEIDKMQNYNSARSPRKGIGN